MRRAARGFSGLKLKAWRCAPCSEPVGVPLAAGWPRELWKDQKSKETCPPGSGETQQPGGVQAASGTVSACGQIPKILLFCLLSFAGRRSSCCLPGLTNIPLFLQTAAFSCILPTQRRSQPIVNRSVKRSARASTSLQFFFTLVLLCCTLP